MDFRTLSTLRREHPAWRLLAADHAPLVVGFLYQSFIRPNVRTLAQQDLTSRLEDHFYHLRQQTGDDAFPRPALHYLDDWASDGRGWLRKYYPADSDEPHYDVTPAAEKAIDWLAGLQRPQFVGTESRLMIVFDLLRQMVEGTETDPQMRIAELERRKAGIEADIRRIRDGELVLMDATQVKDRFLQTAGTARGLLGDFREVEQNFRSPRRRRGPSASSSSTRRSAAARTSPRATGSSCSGAWTSRPSAPGHDASAASTASGLRRITRR